MCHQNCCCTDLSRDEEIIGDESLLIYCKPVMLYNIIHTRSLYNPSFLRRCLSYKTNSSRKRRFRNSIVVFNYRDYNNMVQKTEVTEDFSCPFCSMQCISFKGLRYHLWSSHDLFNFEFWLTDEYQAVNVSLNFDRFETENFPESVELRQKAFSFCSRRRRGRSRNFGKNEKRVSVQFLELELPAVTDTEINKELLETHDGDNLLKTNQSEKDLQNEKHDCGLELPNGVELLERVASSSNIHGATLAKVQSSADPDAKLLCSHDPSLPSLLHVSKARKLATERSDSRNRLLLQKRQFYHSRRVQPMELEQVMLDFDSEDEVNDDIEDFEDRRMLDDFVDVSNDEKQFMHLWNSFVRKQRVLADGHVPWACEAFSKLHGPELVSSPALFWCWRLFMIKLWNHGLLDACTMNNCNTILERYRNQGS